MFPPNTQHFRDDAIGLVKQRERRCVVPVVSSNRALVRSTKTNGDSDMFSSREHPGFLPSGESDVTIFRPMSTYDEFYRPAPMAPPGGHKQPARREEEWEAELKVAKEKHRLSQRRYYKKKDCFVRLENGNDQLRREINRLRRKYQDIRHRVIPKVTVWTVVTEYFQVFRNGFHADGRKQFDFARTGMTPDITHNSGRGIESLTTNWRLRSGWFEDIELDALDLKKSLDGSIVATTNTSFTISEKTLQNVFLSLSQVRWRF
ncbi:hypothetical protein GN244_ATG20067 [Phytophthora infestans]|uniref:BZIP domain-containing protein n=1 Tax=Phytophthora infestans TaxID=4787 RepID=A0A833STN2_PHYIN|nr:hypothetical protein GN244_ATG20067 [Phytophthora infestans]